MPSSPLLRCAETFSPHFKAEVLQTTVFCQLLVKLEWLVFWFCRLSQARLLGPLALQALKAAQWSAAPELLFVRVVAAV